LPKILVIDDDALIRDLISCILEMEGHSVVAAGNGIEGVNRHRAELPDLTITDMIMPEQGGAETIIQIWRATPDAKIIAISGGGGLDGTQPLIVAKRLGVIEVLRKPFSADKLIACITRSLSRLPIENN
jgi:CheY-like chemotaxis protein